MATATASAVPATADKMKAVEVNESPFLIGRREHLHVLQVALVARVHVILHGKPGNAKSMTTDRLLAHYPDLRTVKTQAYKASPPEQFLGQISFKAMENDEFRRITTRKFPDSEVYYCDETPRAPRAVLPAFQSGMAEREFDNGDGPQPIPLMSFIGTSNHLPDDEELQAFFDRFTLKLVVEPPQSQQDFLAIMRAGIERRAATAAGTLPDPDPLITRDELVAMQNFATTVHVPDDFLEAFGELWANVLGLGIEPSVRRYVDMVAAVQAHAAIDGRTEVVQDDILLAAHALWTSEDERDAVYGEVVKFASEWQREKSDAVDGWSDVKDKLVTLQKEVAQVQRPSADHRDAGLNLVEESNILRERVEKVVADAAGRDTHELDSVTAGIDQMKSWVEQRLLGGLSLS